jgi:hypothetical protein
MNDPVIPSLEEFLNTPVDAVCQVAPATFIYAASGTRRAAALAGVSTQGDALARWTQQELWRVVALIFQHGVRHLWMPMLGPSQFNETTDDYQEHLWRWFEHGLTGPEALAHYRANGWRVRIAASEFIPELQAAGDLLKAQTPAGGAHTLWCYAIPDYDAPIRWLLEAARRANTADLDQVAQALYGEPVAPASVYMSTGKPLLSNLQIPPLLMRGPLQGYWNQKPGYSLNEDSLRRMVYDYAYLRQTWRKDKTGRAESAVVYRSVWDQAPILGVGVRLGAFWYPAPIASPEEIS